jgi:hypothetical protein
LGKARTPYYVTEDKCQKTKKMNGIWIEQIYLRMDEIDKRIDRINKELGIKDNNSRRSEYNKA